MLLRLKEVVDYLAKVGNNLNQATILAHQGKVKVLDLFSVKMVVKDIWQLLSLLTGQIKLTGP